MATLDAPNDDLLLRAILRDILESVTDAVITIDEQHRVIFCNRAAEVMFGYSCEELFGKDVSPLIPQPHHPLHQGYVNRYIESGIPRVIGKVRECYGQHKDGGSFPVEISYSVSQTQGQLYFTAVIRDITERRAMEQEMRFMEKLANMGKAVSHIVHEIRKPLMLIGGFARQVEHSRALEASAGERRKLDIIVDEVKRLEALLNNLRLLSRPPALSQKRLLAIHEVIRETLDLLEPLLQDRRIELIVELDPISAMVQGDPDQLKQVFLNLLHNAVDAMQGVGRLRIASQRIEVRIQILIQDSGPGIPPELQEKIFDPFFTTKAEGTGLGLAISKSIIQDHGGNISLRSSPLQGTTMIIELPLAMDAFNLPQQ